MVLKIKVVVVVIIIKKADLPNMLFSSCFTFFLVFFILICDFFFFFNPKIFTDETHVKMELQLKTCSVSYRNIVFIPKTKYDHIKVWKGTAMASKQV